MTRRLALRIVAMVSAGWLPVGPTAWAQKNFDQPPQMGNSATRGRADSHNTRFTLINDSSQTIDNLNISPSEDDSWGDDLLGTLAIPAHNRIIAGPTQETGCRFDVRVVYHDHREEVMRRQNLCDLEELAFSGRNARLPRTRSQSDN
jgi:hypothetical protein